MGGGIGGEGKLGEGRGRKFRGKGEGFWRDGMDG